MTQREPVTGNSNETPQLFHFPQGMIGFPDARRFAFIYHGGGDIACMQSADIPELAFLVTPWDVERLGPPPELGDEARACLHLKPNDTPLWMLVLNPFADEAWVTANLQAPLAINMSARIGLQAIRNEEGLEIRYQWMPQPKKAA